MNLTSLPVKFKKPFKLIFNQNFLKWVIQLLLNATSHNVEKNTTTLVKLAKYSCNELYKISSQFDFNQRMEGILDIYTQEEHLENALQHAKWMKDQFDIEMVSLSKDECFKIEPSLQHVQKDIIGGVYCTEEFCGDARKLVQELCKWLSERGTEFHFEKNIIEFQKDMNGIKEIICEDGSRFGGDVFVLCTGPNTNNIFKKIGISLPMQPIKGYSLTLTTSEKGEDVIPKRPVFDISEKIVCSPLGKNQLRIAGIAELSSDYEHLNEKSIQQLFECGTILFPKLKNNIVKKESWSGLRPVTIDSIPIIGLGRKDINNLYLNCGHGGLGNSLCFGSASIITELITGIEQYELSRELIQAVSINRFY